MNNYCPPSPFLTFQLFLVGFDRTHTHTHTVVQALLSKEADTSPPKSYTGAHHAFPLLLVSSNSFASLLLLLFFVCLFASAIS